MTAFIGSYGFVRGISLYAGGFINEMDVIDHSDTALKGVKPTFGLYILGILVLFAIGVLVQNKQKK